MKIKTAILLNNLTLTKWQEEAIKEAKKKIDIVIILNCKNSKTKKKIFRHFFYYLLNLFSLKNIQTKRIKYINPHAKIINFNSNYIENWEFIPEKIYDELLKQKISLVIKFGMNLLKIEEKYKYISFLSFHHGDPSKYRGRPSGFYELINNEETIGIIVQKLSNNLDAGKILAFAETKVVNFSYKKTSINFYTFSKYLLSKAIDNLINKRVIEINTNGKNYKLPSNTTVLKFTFKIMINIFSRLIQASFFEKKWNVAIFSNKLKLEGTEFLSSKDFINIPISKSYSFYADPFFSLNKSSIRLEALRNNTGFGEIIEISIKDLSKQETILSGFHNSYPFSFSYKDNEYLLPEVSNYSDQYLISMNKNHQDKFYIKGLRNKRIVDPTLIRHNDIWFLFFSEVDTANTLLELWYAKSPFDEFLEHPKSPIVISPKIARMGGRIFKKNNSLFRFGQNSSKNYGHSLSVNEIKLLNKYDYLEVNVGSIHIDNYSGPHCIDINEDTNKIIFDYYNNKFSLLAGFRRIKLKLMNYFS